jgi:2-C-methyl-D-erythritol 4-phosphate cytidylyltransferase / 2-C-methyl-D-erythritol 2,4-cyclodiphosphate synthase
MDVTALIVAAGSGSRMGGDLPKQYRPIGGKAVLAHAVEALARHPGIRAVRVVIGPGARRA